MVVRTIDYVWIPVSAGCRLSARIWMPDGAADDPVPAILEADPYRKNDFTAAEDAPMHSYFAAHGYASVRLDIRGSGDSDGVLLDEYLPLEQQDALDVLNWLAGQPWCTGKVGMIGYSWGGFAALQAASYGPSELAAVISVNSTDDRYADDVHYMGGCVLASDMLSWSITMLAFCARPPDPAVVGDRWYSQWRERLEAAAPWVETWLTHQRRDAYWRQGSVCESYAAIRCPVYMVGGWADPYRNAVLRFLANHPGPHKGLIGPWTHGYPHHGTHGPAIGFLQECVRWWDHWLKDTNNGISEEPTLRAWMPDPAPADPANGEGRWIAEHSWPSPTVHATKLHLGNGVLTTESGHVEEMAVDLRSPQTPASDPGPWCPYGEPTEFVGDQQSADRQWLTFDSRPLPKRWEILGFPELTIDVAADQPVTYLAVRLCDVGPDGTSTLITRGMTNLCHRDGHDRTDPIPADERITVTVLLGAIGYAIPAGHRLRLALSTTYWPWMWPSPTPVGLTVWTSRQSALQLPLRPIVDEPAPPEHFANPAAGHALERQLGARARPARRRLTRNPADTVELTYDHDQVEATLPNNAPGYSYEGRDIYRITEHDPLSATTTSHRSLGLWRDDWRVSIHASGTMTATTGSFHLTNTLEAWKDARRVFVKTWTKTIHRTS